MPPEESPLMVCNRCKKEYNQDTQELDDLGKGWCDTCVEAHNSELSSGGPADKRQQTEQAARRLLK